MFMEETWPTANLLVLAVPFFKLKFERCICADKYVISDDTLISSNQPDLAFGSTLVLRSSIRGENITE